MEKYIPSSGEINPDERKSKEQIWKEIPKPKETLYIKESGEIVDEKPKSEWMIKYEKIIGRELSLEEWEMLRKKSKEKNRKSLDDLIARLDIKLDSKKE